MSASGVRAGRAFVELGSDDGPLRKSLDAMSSRFSAWGRAVANVGKQMVTVGLAASAALNSTVYLFESLGDGMKRASERTGIAVESLSALSYAAEQSGVSFEDLENGIKKMQKTIGGLAGGSKEAIQTFDALGIKLDDLRGKSPDEQFSLIADKIAQIQDPTVKAALAMQVFGRNGTTMIPMLSRGAAGIDALKQRAAELGIVMSDADATGAEEFHDRMTELWDVLKAAGFTIGAALAPAIRSMVVSISNGVSSVKKFIDQHRELVTAVSIGVTAFTALGVGLIVAGFALQGIGASLGAVSGVLGIAGKAVGLLTAPLGLLGPLAGGAIGAIKGIGSAVLFVLNPFKLIPLVLGILPAIAAGIGTAFSAVLAVLAAVLSPALLIGAAVVGIAGYFLYTSGIAGQAFGAIKGYASSAATTIYGKFQAVVAKLVDVWDTVKADALEAFGGIRDAFMAGDWALAGQIVMTVLKLEFRRGMIGIWDPLVATFYRVKASLLNGFADLSAGVQSLWATAIEYLTESWQGLKANAQSFMAWFGNAWSAMIDFIADKFTDMLISGDIERRMSEIREKMEGEGKSKDEIDAEVKKQTDVLQSGQDDYVAKSRKDRDEKRKSDYAARQKGIDDTLGKDASGTEKKGDDARAKLEAARQKMLADNMKNATDAIQNIDPAGRAAVEALQKALAEQVAQAGTERAAADQKTPKPVKASEPNPDGMDQLLKRTTASAGTFNANGLFGLGGLSLQQRTAVATENTAKEAAATRKAIEKKKSWYFT